MEWMAGPHPGSKCCVSICRLTVPSSTLASFIQYSRTWPHCVCVSVCMCVCVRQWDKKLRIGKFPMLKFCVDLVYCAPEFLTAYSKLSISWYVHTGIGANISCCSFNCVPATRFFLYNFSSNFCFVVHKLWIIVSVTGLCRDWYCEKLWYTQNDRIYCVQQFCAFLPWGRKGWLFDWVFAQNMKLEFQYFWAYKERKTKKISNKGSTRTGPLISAIPKVSPMD
jgi:hypothetical protein